MNLTEPGKYLKHLEGAKCQKDAKSGENCHILPDSQWVICESDNHIAMACKGGNNGESHNHNDIGHFLYETEGVLLLTDLGSGEYTRQYFSKERYTSV